MNEAIPTQHDPIGVPTSIPVSDAEGDIPNVFATWADLVARSQLALALVFGKQHIIHSMNTAFEHICKTEAHRVLQRDFRDGFSDAAEVGVGALLDRVFLTCEPETAVIQESALPLVGQSYLRYTVWPIIDQHTRCDGLILHVEDITKQMLAREHADQITTNLRMVNEQLLLAGLREQGLAESATREAFHDGLTGLANRSLLLDRLAQTFPSIHRHPSAYILFLLDVDRFKSVNDTFGHLAGDQLLIQIARRLLLCVRPEDTVARIGGDEFAILLVNDTESNEVMRIAERIQQRLGETFNISGHLVTTSASIGIVHSSPSYRHADEMLRDADIALYEAKALGKAQSVVFDTTMQEHVIGQLQLESELRYAIAHDQLQLHYQPIVALATGALSGVEALVRWQHPQRGLLLPKHFLQVAEHTGLIVPLGEWVVRSACAQVNEWQRAHNQPIFIAVNLSARHLKQQSLSATVSTILSQIDLAPTLLHLELTEGTVMEDVAANVVLLAQLVTLGIQLSLDDFGTGYSSLSYLKRLPFSAVKIDRSFIQDMTDDSNAATIVAAIIAMAHRLGLRVIAEGVETAAQLAYLRAEGCDAVQGYLLGRPQSATEIRQRFDQENWLPSDAA